MVGGDAHRGNGVGKGGAVFQEHDQALVVLDDFAEKVVAMGVRQRQFPDLRGGQRQIAGELAVNAQTVVD